MAASPVTVSRDLSHRSRCPYAHRRVMRPQTTVRLRALLILMYGHPTYQAMVVQHMLEGPTIPAISTTHERCTITISDGLGGVTFAIFYMQLPPVHSNLNTAVRSYLQGRIFFGELVIFRVGSRGMRFVNLRSGDRAMAFKAAAR